jgi:hypothetical protein
VSEENIEEQFYIEYQTPVENVVSKIDISKVYLCKGGCEMPLSAFFKLVEDRFQELEKITGLWPGDSN